MRAANSNEITFQQCNELYKLLEVCTTKDDHWSIEAFKLIEITTFYLFYSSSNKKVTIADIYSYLAKRDGNTKQKLEALLSHKDGLTTSTVPKELESNIRIIATVFINKSDTELSGIHSTALYMLAEHLRPSPAAKQNQA